MRWRWNRLLRVALVLFVVWQVLLYAGLWLHLLPLVILGLLLVLAEGWCIAMSVRRLRESNRAMSKALGIVIGFRHVAPPPLAREAYERWCKRHGLQPYGAEEPVH